MKHSEHAVTVLSAIFKAADIKIDSSLNERLVKVSEELKIGRPVTLVWRKLQECTRITVYCHNEAAIRTTKGPISRLDACARPSAFISTCFELINTTLECVDSADFLIKVSPDNSGLTVSRSSGETPYR